MLVADARSGVRAFLDRHARAPLDEPAQVEARRLLELQRNRLLMYTSCGWFFDELSGLEPVQILRYAALVMQYARELGGGALEDEFIRRLQAAPTNVRELPDGAEVYRRLVRPTAVDLRRVIAHYAISSVLEHYDEVAPIYAYEVARRDEAVEAYQGTEARIGHVRVTATVTGEARELIYAVVHFGGHDFSCGVRAWEGAAVYEELKADLLARYARHSMADMVRGMDDVLPRRAVRPAAALPRRSAARLIAARHARRARAARGVVPSRLGGDAEARPLPPRGRRADAGSAGARRTSRAGRRGAHGAR